jgi:hypothetical protein
MEEPTYIKLANQESEYFEENERLLDDLINSMK